MPGVTIDALAAGIRRSTKAPVDVVKKIDDVVGALVNVARPGDVVLTLGAGSIGGVAAKLVDALAKTGKGATA